VSREVREVRQVRGIPLWLLRDYVVEAGGAADGAGTTITGDGWTVRLEQLDDFRVGSLRVGEVRIELTGDDAAALARIRALLEPKLVRAGG